MQYRLSFLLCCDSVLRRFELKPIEELKLKLNSFAEIYSFSLNYS